MTTAPANVRLTLLVNNTAPEELATEHGFSALLEASQSQLLFDTGQGPALAENTERLGVSLKNLEGLVLSHGHYDHTGGIPFVLAQAPGVRLYAHPSVMVARYSHRNGQAKPLGMPEAARRSVKNVPRDARKWVNEPLRLTSWMGLSGPIPRLVEYEDTGGPFTLDPEGSVPDLIEDDLALWLRTTDGLVVIVGCCHAGLINTLRHVQCVTGDRRIAAVIGGFHLLEATDYRLSRTIEALWALDIPLIVPCHCTGQTPQAQLETELGTRVRPGRAGDHFTFTLATETQTAPSRWSR